jgi:phytoene dehydrogenase-like protein
MDAIRTYSELVGGEPGRKYDQKGFEPACSGVVLYLGCASATSTLAHHCFVFSRDAEEEFDAIYKRGEPAPDPTAYLAAPSCSDDTVAPEGGEALYVLVHTPYLRPHHDWSKMFRPYRQVDPRQAEAHRRDGGHRGADRGRAGADAGRYP